MIDFKEKIGIIGIGAVGEAMANIFPKAILYDKFKNIGSIQEINTVDVVFVCVPTPYTEKIGFDYSAIEKVFSVLGGKKIIVIKSTVLPGITEKMQEKYPQHKVLFNPEFLREKTAKEDIKNPFVQIIGYTQKSKFLAKEILKVLPKAPYEFIVPSTEAETTKYFINTFLATKVIFASQIYDLCQKLNINYDLVKEMVRTDSRISYSHLDIYQDKYRGYRGSCFPKDIKSLIQLGNKTKIDLKLLKLVDEMNEKLLKNNKTNLRNKV